MVVSLPGIARSADTITGEVTAIGGGAIQGAVVTVAGPAQRPVTATTAADGSFSIAADGNPPYSLSVQASGFAGQSFAEPPDEPIALDTATFTPLPVYAGSMRETAADATSGIFYGVMNQAPEVYRSLDYGGTWQPVPMRYEDPDTGLKRGAGGLDVLTSSGVPGEVAVTTQGRVEQTFGGIVHYSTDYGLTWRTVGGEVLSPTQPTRSRFLFWGHGSQGAPNVMLVAHTEANGTWSVYRADMS
nr:carboxypeptidase regulatory-like domain-containing protein [Actinomycetota bacterium]